ncbi:TPA: type II secretion system protein, partial [Candidatus Scatenecus faecavium]|nr:type II secretion system protein [Candidatus Scatenecus faecavium]
MGAPENDSPVRFSSISDKKNFAFTLSEVLITLGIVSVIAAMTLPSIIGNYKKKTYVTALQKFYTEFSQALQNSQADAGCGELECFGLSPNLTDSEWTNNAQSWLKKNF